MEVCLSDGNANGWSSGWLIKIVIAMGSALAFGNCQFAFSGNSALAQELKPIPDNTLSVESSVVTPNISIVLNIGAYGHTL